MLRYNPRKMENLTVESDSELPLKDVAGNSLELSIEIVPGGAEPFGVKLCCSPDGVEQTVVLYDAAEKRSEQEKVTAEVTRTLVQVTRAGYSVV